MTRYTIFLWRGCTLCIVFAAIQIWECRQLFHTGKNGRPYKHFEEVDQGWYIVSQSIKYERNDDEFDEGEESGVRSQVAGLSCEVHGGPSEELAEDMVYWEDIISDAAFVSPFKKENLDGTNSHHLETRYLTFEPDEGGWNNLRMALETSIVLAIAMGRTLVLPPAFSIYLLEAAADANMRRLAELSRHSRRRQKRNKKAVDNRDAHAFDEFFPLDLVESEHVGFKMITLDEFLRREALTGNLRDQVTGEPSFPPENNRTDWGPDGSGGSGTPRNRRSGDAIANWESAREGEGSILWRWMRNVTTLLSWNHKTCVAAIPGDTGGNAVRRMNGYLEQVLQRDRARTAESATETNWKARVESFVSRPNDVTSDPVDRLSELLANRAELCVYDEYLRSARVLHIPGEQKRGGGSFRFLTHFYSFIFFEDWRQDLWSKRFVRDHLRYTDEIQCAAARVVAAVRRRAVESGGGYDSIHVRRGDFQYDFMHLSAEEIYKDNTRSMLRDGRTLYVATDEKNLTFFEMWREHYNVLFLKDFAHELQGLHPNYYGMVDQLVAALGDTFVGTYFSSFTGYINRIRGYHSQKAGDVGYEHGLLDSYHYAPNALDYLRPLMRTYHSVEPPFFKQEFPVAWRDLDHDVVDVS